MRAISNPYPPGSALARWRQEQPASPLKHGWKRYSFPYLFGRFCLLLPGNLARFIVLSIEILFLNHFFGFEQTLSLTLLRLAILAFPAAWWGIMEPTRKALRETYQQRNMTAFTAIVAHHFHRSRRASVGYGLAFIAIAFAFALLQADPWVICWILLMGLRGSITLWARAYHAIAYSICRIYIPVVLFVLTEACLFLAAIPLSHYIGNWALFVAIGIMLAIQTHIVLLQTNRQLRRLNLDRYIHWQWFSRRAKPAESSYRPYIDSAFATVFSALLLRIHTIIPLKLLIIFLWLHPQSSDSLPLVLFALMPWLTWPLFFPSLLHHDFLYHLSARRQYHYMLVARRSLMIVSLATGLIGIALHGIAALLPGLSGYAEFPFLLTALAIGSGGALLIEGYAAFHRYAHRKIILGALLWYGLMLTALVAAQNIEPFLWCSLVINLFVFVLARRCDNADFTASGHWLHYYVWKQYVVRHKAPLTLIAVELAEPWTRLQRESWVRDPFLRQHHATAAFYSKAFSVVALERNGMPDTMIKQSILQQSGGTIQSLHLFTANSNKAALAVLDGWLHSAMTIATTRRVLRPAEIGDA